MPRPRSRRDEGRCGVDYARFGAPAPPLPAPRTTPLRGDSDLRWSVVAVATVGNNVLSTSAFPQLTTVDLHIADKGAAMMVTVVRLFRGEQFGADSPLPLDLVIREPTGA